MTPNYSTMDDTPEQKAAKAAAVSTFKEETSKLNAEDWHDLVGMTRDQAAKGSDVRSISFGRDVRRGADVDLSKPVDMTFLSLGHETNGTLLFHGTVEGGRFTFKDPEFNVPAPGSNLAKANARIAETERDRGPRLGDTSDPQAYVDKYFKKGADGPVAADPAAQERHVRVFVTASELGGALTYAMIHDAKVETNHEVMNGLRTLSSAVEQPVYALQGERMARTGVSKVGKDGMEDLFRTFNSKGYRGLWVDPEKAAAIPGGTDELARLEAISKVRDPRQGRKVEGRAKDSGVGR